MKKRKHPMIAVFFIISCAMVSMPIVLVILSSFLSDRNLYNIYGNMVEVRMGIYKLERARQTFFIDMFPSVTLNHYINIFRDEQEILTAYLNSIKLTIAIVLGNTLFSIITAFVLAKVPFKGSKLIFYIFVVLMIMPVQVTLFPNYILFEKLNLLNNLWSVVIPGIFNAFGIFILKQYMSYIPDEFISSSRIDGATYIKSLHLIVIPMAKPAILSVVIFSLIDSWNMIEQPMIFLQDFSKMPLSLFLFNIRIEQIGTGMAASSLFMLPVLLVFVLCRKYLIQGIQLSGIK